MLKINNKNSPTDKPIWEIYIYKKNYKKGAFVITATLNIYKNRAFYLNEFVHFQVKRSKCPYVT